MKDLKEYIHELSINEDHSTTLSIKLDNMGELYNLLNALYTEYLNLKSQRKKQYMKECEKLYAKILAACEPAGIEVDDEYNKPLSKVIFESINESKTTGDGSIQMIQTIIDQLREHPDMKGKDKEVWKSAGQFLWDYLKELDEKSLQNIMDTFGLVKMSDWEGCKPEDVQLGMHIYLTNSKEAN